MDINNNMRYNMWWIYQAFLTLGNQRFKSRFMSSLFLSLIPERIRLHNKNIQTMNVLIDWSHGDIIDDRKKHITDDGHWAYDEWRENYRDWGIFWVIIISSLGRYDGDLLHFFYHFLHRFLDKIVETSFEVWKIFKPPIILLYAIIGILAAMDDKTIVRVVLIITARYDCHEVQ